MNTYATCHLLVIGGGIIGVRVEREAYLISFLKGRLCYKLFL